jgi:outer membrane protein W
MKSIFLILLLIAALPLAAQVQQLNQFGPKLGLGYYQIAYGSKTQQTDLTATLDSLQKGGLALDFGMTYKRRITRELSLVTGFQFGKNQVRYQENSLPAVAMMRQVFYQFSLPIGLEYNFITENWQPFVGCYLNATKVVNSDMQYILQEAWNATTIATYLPENTLLYGMSFMVGAQLPMTEHWTLEPAVLAAASLRSLSQSGAAQRPVNLNFQTTILYNF